MNNFDQTDGSLKRKNQINKVRPIDMDKNEWKDFYLSRVDPIRPSPSDEEPFTSISTGDLLSVSPLRGRSNYSHNSVKELHLQIPSIHIDSAICDLLLIISSFSDESFDAEFINLEEHEVEEIVVKLIKTMTNNISGKILAIFLQEIRQE